MPGGPECIIHLVGPLSMLHQVVGHLGDRCRTFANTRVFGGVEAPSVADVLWINRPGAWGVNLMSLRAAHGLAPGRGFSALYLIFVNGVTHLVVAARLRGCNPGLVSGVALFLPFGLHGIVAVPASAGQHAFSLAVALAVHAAIVVVVKRSVDRARAA